MVRWVVGSILRGVDPLNYFSFQPVLHDWCNKGHGMCYPVCGMMHIKEPLLLISQCDGSGFPLSFYLSGPLPYARHHITVNNMLSASLNKTFPSFLPYGVRHMTKDHSDSERGNPLPPLHVLFSLTSIMGSFICTIPHTQKHILWLLLHQSWSTGWNKK